MAFPAFFGKVLLVYDIEKILPKWKIVKIIGEGSFGKVFEICRNEYGIEEHSALKVISIPQSDNEVKTLKNDGLNDSETTDYFKAVVNDFVKEIKLMKQLKGCPNIVSYEDFAVVERTESIGFEIFIRMELLKPLPDYLQENRVRVYDVIQLGIDMCKALEVCRETNIVHRDIKPDNIFVSAEGVFKLGDFGIARTLEKTKAGLSRKGTYNYMAPEVYNGNDYGFSADIYSLGLVLYKLLNNNREPFLPPYPAPVKYADKSEALVKRIQGEALPVPENADEELADVIFKACSYNPEARYLYPKEFKEALESISIKYTELQNDVFVKTGINYYVNDTLYKSKNDESIREKNSGTQLLYTCLPNGSVPVRETCPVCGNVIKEKDLFCGHCGYKLKQIIKCSRCGFIMKNGVRFCGKCGQRMC